jgi:hypothetical protein
MHFSWWLGLGYLVLVLVVAFRMGQADEQGAAFGLLIIGAWVSTLTWQLIDGGLQSVGITHGVVLGLLALLVFFRLDLRALSRSAPLLAPLTLLVLLVPILTEDVWRNASSVSSGQLVGLSLFLVVPTLLLLQRRLEASVRESYSGAIAEMTEERAAGLTEDAVRKASSRDDARWLSATLPELKGAYGENRDRAAQVPEALASHFRRTLARRLLPTVVVTGALAAAYLYGVACLAVARPVAQTWSGVPAETIRSDLIVTIDLPVGPYLSIAVFLGVVATAIFMTLVLTDDRYSLALSEALLRNPVEVSLALGVPYLALKESADRPPEPNSEIRVRRGSSSRTTSTS